MNLIIDQELDLDLSDFCDFIIKYIQENLSRSLDERKLLRYDDYINNNIKIDFAYNKRRILSSKELIISSTYNLIKRKFSKYYMIEIDPNIYIKDTNIKLVDIIKLINYGSLTLQPYPIYSNIMEEIAGDLDTLYEQFLIEGK